MNSFLSTSRDRSNAFYFARQAPASHKTQKVIFEIETNPRLETKPFGDVTKIIYFSGEGEIMVILGALFRIEKVVEDKKDQLWVVHVSLASEDDYHLKEMFSYMKMPIGDETDLESLGKILIEMGECGQAQQGYRKMLPEAKLVVGNAELGLGKAYTWADNDKGLIHLSKALQIRQELLDENHADIGEFYSYIGSLYWSIQNDYEEALSNLKRTYLDLGTTYGFIDEYDLALKYYDKALMIRQKVLPCNHPNIAVTYNNIAWVYENKGGYPKALQYYEKSAEMNRKTLPPTHADFVRTENNIRKLKNKMKNCNDTKL